LTYTLELYYKTKKPIFDVMGINLREGAMGNDNPETQAILGTIHTKKTNKPKTQHRKLKNMSNTNPPK